MNEENEKTKAIKDYALKQLFVAIAQIGETAIDAREHGLTAGHIKYMRNMVSLMEKIVDIADSADYNEMIHCLLVGIPKKRTQKTDQETTSEPEPETNQESTSEEINPNDEPVEPQPTADVNETPNQEYKECPEC